MTVLESPVIFHMTSFNNKQTRGGNSKSRRNAKRSNGTTFSMRQYDPFLSETKEMFTRPLPKTRNRKELKFLDLAYSQAYVFDTTGTVTALNLVAEGDDNNSRNGRQIQLCSVEVQGKANPVDGSTTPDFCRLMLIYDSQANGALPAITDILSAATSNSFLNLDNRDRFHIIVDHKFVIGALSTTATQTYAESPTLELIDIHRKLSLHTTFKGTTGAIASIATGALLMVSIGDVPPNDGALAGVSTRIRFTDTSF